MLRFLLLAMFIAAQLPALDVNSILPASGQTSFVFSGDILRYKGSPIAITITFSAAIPGKPDLSKLTFPNTANPSITPIDGTNRTGWLLRATPTADGQTTLTLQAGFASDGTNALSTAASKVLVLDTDPTVSVGASIIGTTVRFTIAPTTGFESGETLINVSTNQLVVRGGSIQGSPGVVSGALQVNVSPYGYGLINLVAQSGTIRDKWLNSSMEVTGSADYAAPPGIIAPTVVRVVGLEPDNTIFRTGNTVRLAVEFNRTVSVVGGNPVLALNSSGSGPLAYALFSGVDSDPRRLLFTYTVLDGNRSLSLDTVSTSSLQIPSQGGIIGTATTPDGLAVTTLPNPGSNGSLSGNILYAINVDASKPNPADIPGADKPSNCGAGSGVALALGASWLGLSLIRRRRAA